MTYSTVYLTIIHKPNLFGIMVLGRALTHVWCLWNRVIILLPFLQQIPSWYPCYVSILFKVFNSFPDWHKHQTNLLLNIWNMMGQHLSHLISPPTTHLLYWINKPEIKNCHLYNWMYVRAQACMNTHEYIVSTIDTAIVLEPVHIVRSL